MSVALDTNLLVALLAGRGERANQIADVLEVQGEHGSLLISPVVYSELLAGPNRRVEDVDEVLTETRINVAWEIHPAVWIHAGSRYGRYAERRRRSGGGTPRRVLADFLIGAHARELGGLLTLDPEFYRINFPDLRVLTP